MSHSLIIQKLAKYGADDNTVSLIKDYLRGHKQLIKNICRKVSQQIAVLKRMKKLLPLKLREKLYRTLNLLLHILIIVQSLGISAVIA